MKPISRDKEQQIQRPDHILMIQAEHYARRGEGETADGVAGKIQKPRRVDKQASRKLYRKKSLSKKDSV